MSVSVDTNAPVRAGPNSHYGGDWDASRPPSRPSPSKTPAEILMEKLQALARPGSLRGRQLEGARSAFQEAHTHVFGEGAPSCISRPLDRDVCYVTKTQYTQALEPFEEFRVLHQSSSLPYGITPSDLDNQRADFDAYIQDRFKGAPAYDPPEPRAPPGIASRNDSVVTDSAPPASTARSYDASRTYPRMTGSSSSVSTVSTVVPSPRPDRPSSPQTRQALVSTPRSSSRIVEHVYSYPSALDYPAPVVPTSHSPAQGDQISECTVTIKDLGNGFSVWTIADEEGAASSPPVPTSLVYTHLVLTLLSVPTPVPQTLPDLPQKTMGLDDFSRWSLFRQGQPRTPVTSDVSRVPGPVQFEYAEPSSSAPTSAFLLDNRLPRGTENSYTEYTLSRGPTWCPQCCDWYDKDDTTYSADGWYDGVRPMDLNETAPTALWVSSASPSFAY